MMGKVQCHFKREKKIAYGRAATEKHLHATVNNNVNVNPLCYVNNLNVSSMWRHVIVLHR